MTFGPGSTYGEEGPARPASYMVLTWIGIVVMVIVFVGWIVYENRRLVALRRQQRPRPGPTDEPPPQPGMTT